MPQATVAQQQTAITLGLKSQLIEDYLYHRASPQISATGDMLALGNGLVVADGTALYHFTPDKSSQSGWDMSQIPYAVPSNAVDATHVMIKAFELPGANGPSLNILCFYRAAGGGFSVAFLARTLDQVGSDGTVTVRGSWRQANLSFAAASCLSQVADVDVFDAGADIGVFVYGSTLPMMNTASQTNNAQFFILYFNDYNYLDTSAWHLGSQSFVSKYNIGYGAAPRFRFLTTGAVDTQRETCLAWWDTQAPTTVSWLAVSLDNRATMTFEKSGVDMDPALPILSYTLQSNGTIQALEPVRSPLDTDSQSWTAIVRDQATVTRLQLGKGAGGYGSESSLMPSSLGAIDSLDLTLGPDNIVSLVAAIDNSLYIQRSLGGKWIHLRNKLNTWSNASGNLQNNVAAIAVPDTHPAALNLFYASRVIASGTREPVYEIVHMSEDIAHQAWLEQKIGLLEPDTTGVSHGTIDPVEVASVSIDVSVVDQDKRPSPFAKVTLTVDQWGTYIIDEWIVDQGATASASGQIVHSSYWLGPGTSVTFLADSIGRANVRHEAHSLQFAKLSFAAALSTDTSIQASPLWVQGDVVQDQDADSPVQPPLPRLSSVAGRLAGKDTLHPMTRSSLETAGLIVPLSQGGPSDTSVTHITNMLASTGQWMLKQASPAPSAALTHRAWSLTKGPDGNFDWSETPPGQPALAASFSFDPWDDIKDAWHDVTNAVKHGVEDVASATVDIAEEGITFAINIGKETVTVVTKTLKQAGDLVGTIFALVGKVAGDIVAFIRKVVDFLKFLLEWHDICRTHNVIRHAINWILSAAVFKTDVNFVDSDPFSIKSYVNRHFAAQFTGTLTTNLAQAKGYHPTDTANGRADTESGQTGAMTNPTPPSHLDHHSSSCMYAYNRVKAHAVNIGPGQAGSALDGNLVASIQAAWPHTEPASPNPSSPTPVDTAINQLLRKLEAIDIAGILNKSLGFFYDLFEDLVKLAVNGVETVIDVLIKLVHDKIKDVQDVLDKHIHIPFITWAYKKFAHAPHLTLLDVLCLIASAPATILYKLTKGGEAPYGSDDDMNATMDAFVVTPPVNGANGSVSLNLTTDAATAAGKILGVVSGVINIFASQFGIWSDGITIAGAATETPVPNPLGWPCLFLSGTALATAMPLSTFLDYNDNEATNICMTIYYGLEWLPLAADLLCLLTSESLLKNYPNFGPLAEGLFGDAIVYAGLAYIIADCIQTKAKGGSIDEATIFAFVNVLVSSLPRPLRGTIPLAAGLTPLALGVAAVVLGGDEVGLVAGSVTQIGSSL